MKFKLTSLEKKWVLYDVGNSAFTMMVSTIFPIYFNALAEGAGISDVDYLAYWGYATSVCTLIVAILGPTLGAIADTKNFKKIVFSISMGIGVFGCILLGFLSSWIWFLGVFVLAKTGYSASLIFYDAMLTDVTEPERMDSVSSHGYAWGYIGSCIPFIACLGIVLGAGSLGIGTQTSMILAFVITAVAILFISAGKQTVLMQESEVNWYYFLYLFGSIASILGLINLWIYRKALYKIFISDEESENEKES